MLAALVLLCSIGAVAWSCLMTRDAGAAPLVEGASTMAEVTTALASRRGSSKAPTIRASAITSRYARRTERIRYDKSFAPAIAQPPARLQKAMNCKELGVALQACSRAEALPKKPHPHARRPRRQVLQAGMKAILQAAGGTTNPDNQGWVGQKIGRVWEDRRLVTAETHACNRISRSASRERQFDWG
jgi:hypothetical protein